MSETIDTPDLPEMLAAEYVVGTLDADDAARAERRAQTDPDFAAELRYWEAKLTPLTVLAKPLPPPAALLARIETSISALAAPRSANDNALRWWRATAIAGLATAAGLAVFIGLRPPVSAPAPGAPAYAVLAPLSGGATPELVAISGPDGSIVVHATAAIAIAPDRDLQLWSLPEGAKAPASLGVLPPTGTRVPPGVQLGTKLLVSLEPKGGSPTGQPTGPVVYGGTLEKAE
jgi:anti-sigma-K factor RskA